MIIKKSSKCKGEMKGEYSITANHIPLTKGINVTIKEENIKAV